MRSARAPRVGHARIALRDALGPHAQAAVAVCALRFAARAVQPAASWRQGGLGLAGARTGFGGRHSDDDVDMVAQLGRLLPVFVILIISVFCYCYRRSDDKKRIFELERARALDERHVLRATCAD